MSALPALWSGGLLALGAALRGEALVAPPPGAAPAGPWCARLLPGGTLIAFRRVASQRLEARIARPDRPILEARRRWEQELAVAERYLGLTGWTREAERGARGVALRYTEPAAVSRDVPSRASSRRLPSASSREGIACLTGVLGGGAPPLTPDRLAAADRAREASGG